MENNLSSFLEWLRAVMKEKDINPADIARTGLVTDSAVSLLFKGTTKSVSIEMCKAVAKATNIPLITVYRAAGHYPPANDDPWVDGMVEKLNRLPPNFRYIADAFFDSLLDQEQEKQLKPKAVTHK